MPERRIINGYIVEKRDDGTIVTIGPAQPQMPADPAFQYAGPKAAADAQRAQAQATVESSTIDAQIRRANAEAAAAQAKANQAIAEAGSGGGQTTGQKKVDERYAQEYTDWAAAGGFSQLQSQLKLLADAVDVLENNDTISGPVIGRLPFAIQQMIDPRSKDVRADVERVIQTSLKQILGGQFAQKEAEQLFARTYDPTQPEGSNAKRIKDTLAELYNRGAVKDSAARYYESNGTLTGWTPPQPGTPETVWKQVFRADDNPLAAASFGADTQGQPIPPAYQQAYNAFVQSGNWTPEQYAAFRGALDKQYFPNPGDQRDTYLEEGRRIRETMGKGGDLNLSIPPTEVPLSGLDKFRNDLAANPLGAAGISYADMAGFGIPTMLAPDQMNAMQEQSPISSTIGQIGGAVTGTSMLGNFARNGLERLGPTIAQRLLGGGGKAQFGRNVAADTAFSGIYGQNAEGAPVENAAWGAGGSVGGQFAGRIAARMLGGIPTTEAAQSLVDRGIPLTVGQRMGGTAKGIEDAMTSIPGVGDIVNARRGEGFQAFNRAAFDEAGKPIGVRVSEFGERGVDSLIDRAGNAYDNATAGVDVPIDPQFIQDIAAARAKGAQLPPDLATKFNLAMDNRIGPIEASPSMTGEQYQQAFRGLKGYRAENVKPGFEQDYRDALTSGMDALTGVIKRGGGQDVVMNLNDADKAYRGAKTIQKAVQAAKNGSGSGEIQVFTPAQLNTASTQAANKYGGGRQFADLIDAGQQTLPSKLPDSGTSKRLLAMALPSALGGSAAGYYAGGGEGAAAGVGAPLAVGALLAAGGTKGGQKALTKLLLERPKKARQLGLELKKRGGIFGSAALPFVIGP